MMDDELNEDTTLGELIERASKMAEKVMSKMEVEAQEGAEKFLKDHTIDQLINSTANMLMGSDDMDVPPVRSATVKGILKAVYAAGTADGLSLETKLTETLD